MKIEGDVRTYQASEWAARRWDWFNRGKIVEPLSFCQFWRTVLIWATLRWLLRAFLYLPARVGGRIALVGVVNSVEGINGWVDGWATRHATACKRIGPAVLAVYLTGIAFVILAAATGSGLWTLVGMGMGFMIGLALYALVRIGAIGLMWQAAVVAKHGICPPVKIEREAEGIDPDYEAAHDAWASEHEEGIAP